MSLAVVRSRAPAAGRAPEVTVEVHLANGLPSFSIVGLPDLEVRESRERVRAALQNCGFDFPVRRITVNLAPADLPKESGRFDLPIALGILAANGQLPPGVLAGREFAGELSLTGALRPMRGAFAMACGTARGELAEGRRRETGAASNVGAGEDVGADENMGAGESIDADEGGGTGGRNDGNAEADQGAAPTGNAAARRRRAPRGLPPPSRGPELYLPLDSAEEAALVPGVTVYGAPDLPALCAHLAGADEARLSPIAAPSPDSTPAANAPDLSEVVGQHGAKRALEIAAAGGHHLLIVFSTDPITAAHRHVQAARVLLPTLLHP